MRRAARLTAEVTSRKSAEAPGRPAPSSACGCSCSAGLSTKRSCAGRRRPRSKERRAAEESARKRVTGAEERLSMLRVRHAELEAAIERAGISGIRDRLAQMESELERAREAERKAIDAAGRARKESDERAADAQEAAARLESASGRARESRAALLPLVD